MISIGRLSNASRAAEYYLTRQAQCRTDYYTGEGERRGVWLGRGATVLGLTGELTPDGEEVFRGLLNGADADGHELVGPVWRADPRGLVDARPLLDAMHDTTARSATVDAHGTVRVSDAQRRTVEALTARVNAARPGLGGRVLVRADVVARIGAATGLDVHAVYTEAGVDLDEALAHANERIDVRRPGYDVVFSAPKSVSVAYGLADPEQAEQIRQAHQAAITEAMGYLELFVARGARGSHIPGEPLRRVKTEGLIAAAFEHRSSRANDPQLHTHVVITNLLRGGDGKWTAVDSAALYRHQLTAGYLYQAVLRGELTQRLGVSWTGVRKGIAEIDGIPKEVCRAFSQRRQAIEQALEAQGGMGMDAARRATLATRPAKSHAPEASLRERWLDRAAELGFTPADLPLHESGIAPEIDASAVVEHLLSDQGLTARRSTFDARDVLRGVCETVPAGAHLDLQTVLELGRQVVRDEDTVPLLHHPAGVEADGGSDSGSHTGARVYSTRELLSTEATAIALVAASQQAGRAIVPASLVETVLDTETLNDEQQHVVRALTGSGAGVTVLVGPAGAGKTRALRAARIAWEHAGCTVLGASLAAVAARQLQTSAGITSSSLTRFLRTIERDGLPSNAVLVLDEAGMIGTRQLLQVMQLTEAAGAKLVLVGDPRQLPELHAGGLFATLAAKDMALQLMSNQRQVEAWERQALSALRDGDPDRALEAYAEHDRIRLAPNRSQLIEQLTADYLRASTNPNTEVVVLAVRNTDVRAVNDSIRGYLRKTGLLSKHELEVGTAERPRGFAVGDRVVVTRNDYPRDLLNGTRARITGLDLRRRTLTLDPGEGRAPVIVDADWVAARLEHGYALTCHRAQGVTVDVAMLFGTAALTREAAYVAMSRGRHTNLLYATVEQVRDHGECGLDQHDTTPEELELLALDGVGRAVARSRRQRLATDHRPFTTSQAFGVGREVPGHERGHGLAG